MPRKPTMTAVARTAGVSPATVDRVLNNRGGVRKELEHKVLEAARSLELDRDLGRVRGRSLQFSVLMNRPDHDVYPRLQRAFLDDQSQRSDKRFACNLNYFGDQSPEEIALRIDSVRADCDGVVIVAYDHPVIMEALAGLNQRPGGVPVVTLLSDLAVPNRIHFAGSGNREAGSLAGDLMGRITGTQNGRILVISRLQRYTAHGDREMGMRSVISEHFPGLDPHHVLECNHGDERDFAKVRAYVAERGPFAGIYNVSSWNVDVVRFLRGTNLCPDAVAISHGTNKRTRVLLRDGLLDFAVEYAPEDCARQAIDALLHHHGRYDEFDRSRKPRLEVFSRTHLPPG